MVHYKQLDNGIRLIVKHMSGLMSVSMGIIVGTGACVESDEEDGISHFIEHMMFKGTAKRSAFQISDEMDAIGAQVNAFTGKDMTCYYAKSTSVHAEEAFEILSDLGKAFFGETNYGRNILGPKKNVRSFKKSDILAYMSERYTPYNIVISMAGNITADKAQEMVEKYFSDMPKGCGKQRSVDVRLQSKSLLKTKDIEQVHIGIAYPSMKRYERLADATMIVNSVLGGSMSSRLFQEVREKLGLAYTVYSYLTSYKDTGSLVIYAGVNAENYLRSVEAIDKCISRLKQKDITEDEFKRGKEQMLSSQIFAQESTSSQMLLYGKELIYSGNIYNFEDRVKKINDVTLSDVFEAIEYNFDDKYRATALVGKADKHL